MDIPLIETTSIGYRFSETDGVAGVHVLKDVSLHLYAGEITALVGPSGCGKTTLAAAILRKTVERMGGTHSVQFANMSRFLDEIRQSYNDDQQSASPMEGIANNYMVVLDDFGKENRNPWVDEKLYSLVDRLYTQGTRVIVTTNLSIPQLGKFDDALLSRLLGICKDVQMKGRDHRADLVQTNK